MSALVRNLVTLTAIVGLFLDKKWAAYALVLAALLGAWRRLGYLAPLLAQGPGDSVVAATGGLDLGFRMLLLGVAIGWFSANRQGHES